MLSSPYWRRSRWRRDTKSGLIRSVTTAFTLLIQSTAIKLVPTKVSEMFGGLDICSLEAVVGKDDTEHIIEVNDCAMNLMGDTALEDRNMIAELVIKQMEVNIENRN